MADIDETLAKAIRSELESYSLQHSERVEEFALHFRVSSGSMQASIKLYNSRKLQVQGADSILKSTLEEIKRKVESGVLSSIDQLPTSIQKLPEFVRTQLKDVDEAVIRLFEESIRALEHDLLIAATFLLGASSERAISLLIDSYMGAIKDAKNLAEFQKRTGGRRAISVRFDEFIRSYKSSKTQCTDPRVSNDLEIVLASMFQFYRISRNDVGHPQLPPSMDKGVLIANIGQFAKYIERIYILINYFSNNEVIL